MTKDALTAAVEKARAETKAALQTVYDALNSGQQKKIVKDEKVKALLTFTAWNTASKPKGGGRMTRYKELMTAVCQDDADKTTYGPLVEKAVLLEEKMEALEKLPHIKVDPKDPTRQKTLPAFKQYKELLQQYGNIIRILGRVTVEDENTAESPLRTWAKARAAGNADM